jgi:DNA-binding transcriptional LysR family regulator
MPDSSTPELFDVPIKHLQVFVLSAELNSYARVARQCDLDASSPSKWIAKLEVKLGGRTLLEYDPRRGVVELTEHGRALLPAATRLVSAARDLFP